MLSIPSSLHGLGWVFWGAFTKVWGKVFGRKRVFLVFQSGIMFASACAVILWSISSKIDQAISQGSNRLWVQAGLRADSGKCLDQIDNKVVKRQLFRLGCLFCLQLSLPQDPFQTKLLPCPVTACWAMKFLGDHVYAQMNIAFKGSMFCARMKEDS